MSQVDHFDRLAPRYDELRAPRGVTPVHELLARQGGFAPGTRLLDIGCGTGVHLRVFRDEFGCRVSGVDPSAGMLAEARKKLPAADLRPGVAEELPFQDEMFDAAVMLLVVHHLHRPTAFSEARRVLAPGGRLLITTPDPDAFPSLWMAPLFPSYVEVEQRRFPDGDVLEEELGRNFRAVALTRTSIVRRFTREQAVERIRGRHASTFDLLCDSEYQAGLARAETELPDPVEYTLELLVVRAER